ncbi:MAG TPA: peptidylprolyl isomerase [Sedimentisphaerales bacterium]|nr:peptidylprolyl isomerase [Sedimentisphaerales bacterium]
MQFYRCSKLGIIVCALALLVAADPAAALDAGAVEPNTTAKPQIKEPADTGDVAVTVNGVDLAESQLEELLKVEFDRMAGNAGNMPPAIIQQMKKQMQDRILDRMIVEHLLDEQLRAANIVITEQDVITHLRQSGARQQPPLSLEDIQALVEAQGQSFEEMKKQLRDSKEMKYQKLLEAQFAGKVDVNEADARKYYSENRVRFERPEQVRASHILISPDPNAEPNEAKAAAGAKAEDLLRQIKQGGADFATLAKTNSSCSSSARGGDLGFFGRGEMVPAFEKAAFELKEGQVSDIVETQFGYHIIRVTGHREPEVIGFDQAKDNIINRLTQQKQRELVEQYIESLKAKASIVYPPGKEPAPPRPSVGRPPVSPPPASRPPAPLPPASRPPAPPPPPADR